MENALNSDLFSLISGVKAPRYKVINGKRVKWEHVTEKDSNNQTVISQELLSAKRDEIEDTQITESLMRLDEILESLQQQYLRETNPIIRQILLVKYDLAIEEWPEDQFVREDSAIQKLIQELNSLQCLLQN